MQNTVLTSEKTVEESMTFQDMLEFIKNNNERFKTFNIVIEVDSDIVNEDDLQYSIDNNMSIPIEVKVIDFRLFEDNKDISLSLDSLKQIKNPKKLVFEKLQRPR